MSNRPDLLKATEVTPQIMLSCEYWASSWSARMSYNLTVASSEPVQKAVPWGKNYIFFVKFVIVVVVDFHEIFDFLFFGERSVSKSRESEIEKRKRDQRLVRYFNK